MANPHESQLHYPLGDTLPAPGASIEVAPGVRWLRMPLPFALDHINLWLLRDRIDGREGWTVVDCGVDDAPTRNAWQAVFDTQLGGLPVLRLVVTHMHPDHIGLAHWMAERWTTPEHACRLWISATDYHAARLVGLDRASAAGDGGATFFAHHGLVDTAALERASGRGRTYAGLVPRLPPSFRRLLDGMDVAIGGQTWTALAGHGHAPEHIALHAATPGVLISGDMVLPRISTNVSVFELEPESDPLTLYLSSIERMRALPAQTLVLPSHGKPFVGLHARIGQLVDHHAERLAELKAACAGRAHSAAELLPVLFRRPLDAHQTGFAMGESIAHLNRLWLAGDMARERGSDGVWRFRTVA